jgi:hypothetical protein
MISNIYTIDLVIGLNSLLFSLYIFDNLLSSFRGISPEEKRKKRSFNSKSRGIVDCSQIMWLHFVGGKWSWYWSGTKSLDESSLGAWRAGEQSTTRYDGKRRRRNSPENYCVSTVELSEKVKMLRRPTELRPVPVLLQHWANISVV